MTRRTVVVAVLVLCAAVQPLPSGVRSSLVATLFAAALGLGFVIRRHPPVPKGIGRAAGAQAVLRSAAIGATIAVAFELLAAR